MTSDDDRRIAELLADAEAASGPVAWGRVETLIAALVDLYGRGLERILEHARAARMERAFEERLESDELVRSLLVLHGLHPMSVDMRVERALARVTKEIPESAPLVLARIDEDGAAILAKLHADDDRPVPVTSVIARAIELEAPELVGVRVIDRDGKSASEKKQQSAGKLVPVERLLSRIERGESP